MSNAYKLGIATAVKPDTGESFPVELSNVRRSRRVEWAKVIGEDGKAKERTAKTVTESITFDGTYLAAGGEIGTGYVIKIGGKDYAITDISDTIPAGDYNTVSVTCERQDAEAVVAYTEPAAASGSGE